MGLDSPRGAPVHLAFILGTRPEAIKQAPLVLAAQRRAGVRVTVISTGQHREMLRPIFGLFGFAPDRDLDLMQANQSLAGFAARALAGLDGVLAELAPDAVVVQGDTTSAMVGALAAFYRRIPVAHVEAGLRTDNLDAPFPEEANRRIIGQITRWHLAPTRRAAAMLARDHVEATGGRIFVTGNTVIDALYLALERVASPGVAARPLMERVAQWRAADPTRQVVLITGHRRENFGEPFREFCHALRDIATAFPGALLVYPVHLNPNVQQPVGEILGDTPNVVLAPAADYPEFVALMQAADLVITDSGGVQEEAPALGKPVLVTRDVTERPEAVEAGVVELVGPHRGAIVARATHHLLARTVYPRLSPYGDGRAAERCLAAILGEPAAEFAGA